MEGQVSARECRFSVVRSRAWDAVFLVFCETCNSTLDSPHTLHVLCCRAEERAEKIEDYEDLLEVVSEKLASTEAQLAETCGIWPKLRDAMVGGAVQVNPVEPTKCEPLQALWCLLVTLWCAMVPGGDPTRNPQPLSSYEV